MNSAQLPLPELSLFCKYPSQSVLLYDCEVLANAAAQYEFADNVTLKTVVRKMETRKRIRKRANANGQNEEFKSEALEAEDLRFGVLGGTFWRGYACRHLLSLDASSTIGLLQGSVLFATSLSRISLVSSLLYLSSSFYLPPFYKRHVEGS